MSLNCDTRLGTLSIAEILLHGPAWCAYDLTTLWGQARVRGSDTLIPGASGVLPNPRRITVTEHSLPFLICGEVDDDGDVYDDPWVGLELNLAYLRAEIIDPPGTATGTRAAVLTMPSGAERTADIHVLDIRLGDPLSGDNVMTGRETAAFNATLEISIPAGRFV